MKKESAKEQTWEEIGKAVGAKIEDECKDGKSKNWQFKHGGGGSGGAFYGLGFIGALAYYLLTSNSYWAGFLGILKAILWPAFLVFELMKFLGM